jgi:hypothetical protein
MILIDCPSCEGPVSTSLPLPDELACDACSATWEIADPEAAETLLAA